MFRRYHESGLSIVALKPKSKAPLPNNWSRYSTEMPTEAQVDAWENEYQKMGYGMGLVLGPASNIMALDIDTDNPDTLITAPRSPVVKRGKKGETRFFRFNSSVKACKLHEYGVEVLSTGNHTVLPPSIHPDTLKPYEWLSQMTLLDIDAEDLPELLMSDIELLPKLNTKGPASSPVQPGRNNRLKSIVSAMRLRGETEMRIVDEIYNYDREHHSGNRLFLDHGENFQGSTEEDARLNALLFCARVTQSLVKNKHISFPASEDTSVTIDFDSFDKTKIKSFEYKAPPNIGGFISSYTSLAVAASRSDVSTIALGGALSVLATVACNRFRVRSTWPNLYVLNVAGSGFGKNLPNQLAQILLADTGLLGGANYKSGASMYSYLNKQQERLDTIDEATMLFRAMKSGESWQAEMQEILCTLFSCSNSLFAGVSVKGAGLDKSAGGRDGACYNPCINLLTSTTMQGFRESFDKSMASKGLLPRFLIFNQHTVGAWKEFKGFLEFEKEIESLKEFVRDMMRIEKRVVIDSEDPNQNLLGPKMGKKYDPIDFPLDDNAKALLMDFDRQCFYAAAKDQDEETGPFLNRFCELGIKLSLLIALSEAKASIDVGCVTKAIELVQMQFHNSQLLRGGLSDPKASRLELITTKAITLIKEKGSIPSYLLWRKFKGLNDRDQRSILESLLSSGLVAKRDNKNGSALWYVDDSAETIQ